MAMKHNKRGIFFTFIAILLIMVLTAVFKPETEISFDKDITVVKTRVTKIDNFVEDFENVYMPMIMRSTAYRALTALTYYMDVTGAFLVNLQPAFNEVLMHGTVDGTPIDSIIGETIMTDNTLIFWINRTKKSAEEYLSINITYTITDVSIYQISPWFIQLNLTLNHSILAETANWTRDNIIVETELGIDELYDPLYYVNTDGDYKKKINQTDIKFDEWDTENLKGFIKNESYAHWKDSEAPNFLMRFTGDFSSSPCCGIESAVNPNKLAAQKSRTYIDHLFFNTAIGDCSSPDVLYEITGISDGELPGFKLDWDNTAKYDIVSDAQELACP